jgi:hypothetical protein
MLSTQMLLDYMTLAWAAMTEKHFPLLLVVVPDRLWLASEPHASVLWYTSGQASNVHVNQ